MGVLAYAAEYDPTPHPRFILAYGLSVETGCLLFQPLVSYRISHQVSIRTATTHSERNPCMHQ